MELDEGQNMHGRLWQVENYHSFLAARRQLLADAANTFLDGLAAGDAPTATEAEPSVPSPAAAVIVPLADDEEARIVQTCRTWIAERGLADGIADFELADQASGEAVAILDLAWPHGVQTELTQPVALLLNETSDVERAASAHGFRYFTSLDALKSYIETEVLGDGGEAAL